MAEVELEGRMARTAGAVGDQGMMPIAAHAFLLRSVEAHLLTNACLRLSGMF
jgi:hypothetical protein